MKSEDYVVYDAGEPQEYAKVDCKIKLVGREIPTIDLSNRSKLVEYCRKQISDCAMEEIHMICVNSSLKMISDICISEGNIGSVNAYPGKIAAGALLSNATGVFFYHNHPGGRCAPSADDIASTNMIIKALKMFEIHVYDHLIITPTDSYSMMVHGDIAG